MMTSTQRSKSTTERDQSTDAIVITDEVVEAAERQIIDQSKRIDFYLSEYTVELLAHKMETGEFVVPPYQREFTWEDQRKSRFIESLIMGLPIPFLFFWEMPEGELEIVDGSQRLRTIQEFVSGNFRLGDLDQLTHLSGFRFTDLPQSRQRKIKNRSIRGIILNEHADEVARLDMFERINTGSKIANTAEVRRGALGGPFLDLVIELSHDPLFTRLAPMPQKAEKERGREELVTRFFAYGDGLEEYRDRPSDFMFDYSKKMNGVFTASPDVLVSYKERFHNTMNFIDRVFPFGFAKSASGRATPRARFESIAIGSYQALRERPDIANKSSDELAVDEWVSSKEFTSITGADGANAKSRLIRRIDYVKNKLTAR